MGEVILQTETVADCAWGVELAGCAGNGDEVEVVGHKVVKQRTVAVSVAGGDVGCDLRQGVGYGAELHRPTG